MPLTNEERETLAGIINELSVAERMRRDDPTNQLLWLQRACACDVRLADEFGIVLPGLDVSRGIIANHTVRDAA